MSIQFHPQPGTILICDFDGLREPEMVKRRPVVTISPRFRQRPGLVSVVPLSTTQPNAVFGYHYRLEVNPPLPKPYDSPAHWVKADMVYTVGFHRLQLPRLGRNAEGGREYDIRLISQEDLAAIQACVLCGLGLDRLTDHL